MFSGTIYQLLTLGLGINLPGIGQRKRDSADHPIPRTGDIKLHKSKRRWLCLDCGQCTKLEHYFVHAHVWSQAHTSEQGMLCVGCIETRLKRKLTALDFTSAHINNPRTNSMTDRLRSRIEAVL